MALMSTKVSRLQAFALSRNWAKMRIRGGCALRGLLQKDLYANAHVLTPSEKVLLDRATIILTQIVNTWDRNSATIIEQRKQEIEKEEK